MNKQCLQIKQQQIAVTLETMSSGISVLNLFLELYDNKYGITWFGPKAVLAPLDKTNPRTCCLFKYAKLLDFFIEMETIVSILLSFILFLCIRNSHFFFPTGIYILLVIKS